MIEPQHVLRELTGKSMQDLNETVSQAPTARLMRHVIHEFKYVCARFSKFASTRAAINGIGYAAFLYSMSQIATAVSTCNRMHSQVQIDFKSCKATLQRHQLMTCRQHIQDGCIGGRFDRE